MKKLVILFFVILLVACAPQNRGEEPQLLFADGDWISVGEPLWEGTISSSGLVPDAGFDVPPEGVFLEELEEVEGVSLYILHLPEGITLKKWIPFEKEEEK